MKDWLKQKVAVLGYALVQWAQKPGYVVIYDDPAAEERGEDAETYYGFFTSTDEALEMYDQLSGGRDIYVGPHLCMIMGPISEAEEGN